MPKFPSAGPAWGAYSVASRLEAIVNSLRITHMNAGITPEGTEELTAYLKAVTEFLDTLVVKPAPRKGRKE